jgi:hypothetical protein
MHLQYQELKIYHAPLEVMRQDVSRSSQILAVSGPHYIGLGLPRWQGTEKVQYIASAHISPTTIEEGIDC